MGSERGNERGVAAGRPVSLKGRKLYIPQMSYSGAAAFAAPASYGDAFMAAGFGGLHIIFGLIIARNYGG